MQLPILLLTPNATKAHIVPGLADNSLISIGKLCNEDCEARFTKRNLTITKDNTIILHGKRLLNGLWSIDNLNTKLINYAQEDSRLVAIAFYHAAAGYPAQTA